MEAVEQEANLLAFGEAEGGDGIGTAALTPITLLSRARDGEMRREFLQACGYAPAVRRLFTIRENEFYTWCTKTHICVQPLASRAQ